MTNNDHIAFLEGVIEELQNDTITEYKIELIDKLRLKYNMSKPLFDNNKEYSERDFIKFLLMSWYVYGILSSTDTENINLEDTFD